tara:strand:- start:1218 stop:1487 length:270 start_codon:yes stop_codon:yes gene_type:complete
MVNLYIPLMKDLNLSWKEIKNTPRTELAGLMNGLSNYNILHSFDGYSSEDINDLAKNKPEIRTDYGKSMAMKAKYGMRKKHTDFKDLIG